VSEWGVAPGAGVAAYAALLRDRGLRQLIVASQLARLGCAMLPLGLVLFGTAAGGSPAAGGAVLAGFLATTAFHPARARLVDRAGAKALGGFVAGLCALLVVTSGAAPLVAVAALAGACTPPLGPFTRALTGEALHDRTDALHRAYALDSAGEEASLVLAPLLVAFITELSSAAAAVLFAAVVTLLGGLATARSSLAETLPTASRDASASHPRVPARAWLVIGALAATGTALGAVDVGVPAIARAAGSPAAAGLLLAAMAVGTALAGLLAGLRVWRREPLQRVAILAPALAVAFAGCAIVRPLPALAAALAAPGAILGILFVTAYVAIDALAPPGASTRTFAWLVTANNGGLALGAAVGGALADSDPHAALWLAAAAALPGAAFAAAAAARPGRRRA
jgi:MFS family permease